MGTARRRGCIRSQCSLRRAVDRIGLAVSESGAGKVRRTQRRRLTPRESVKTLGIVDTIPLRHVCASIAGQYRVVREHFASGIGSSHQATRRRRGAIALPGQSRTQASSGYIGDYAAAPLSPNGSEPYRFGPAVPGTAASTIQKAREAAPPI